MIAQQRKADAIIGGDGACAIGVNDAVIGGKEQIGLLRGPIALPRRGGAKAIYPLVHVGPVHGAGLRPARQGWHCQRQQTNRQTGPNLQAHFHLGKFLCDQPATEIFNCSTIGFRV